MLEPVIQRCSVKKVFLKISPEACNSIKKQTLAQVFFYEGCEIFKNTFFIENRWWQLLFSDELDFNLTN